MCRQNDDEDLIDYYPKVCWFGSGSGDCLWKHQSPGQ